MSKNYEAALKGLLLGDGMSRQNGVQRLGLTTERRVNRFQTLTKFSFDNKITTFPEPYVHAFPQDILKLYPGDDCEWFYFSASIVKSGQSFDSEWKKLSNIEKYISGRLGTKTALRNISKGMSAPSSGHDNPHNFDSIAMLRAAAITIFSDTDLQQLMIQVEQDSSQTHSLDGIWCAKAIATLVHHIKKGISLPDALVESESEIPENSLSNQMLTRVKEIIRRNSNELEISLDLEQSFVDRIYCYPYSSSELYALIYAKLWIKSDAQLKFASSFLHRRHNDSLPPLLGLILGLSEGDKWLPKMNSEAFVMDGICIPELKGTSLLQLLS